MSIDDQKDHHEHAYIVDTVTCIESLYIFVLRYVR